MVEDSSTNERLLNKIAEDLRNNPEIDQELGDILITHILAADPANTALDAAQDAIETLATERGNQSQ